MDIESTELHDWELLHPNSSSDSELDLNSPKNHVETEGLIQTNYFSIDTPFVAYGSEKGSEESDNLSWVEPGTLPRKNSGGFLSGSVTEKSEFEGGNDVGVLENPKVQVGFGGIDENEVKFDGIAQVGVVDNSKLQMGFAGNEEMDKTEVGFGGIEDIGSDNGKNYEEYLSDTSEIVKFGDVEEVCVEEKERDEVVEVTSEGGEEKRSLVWWKVPLELLKYCVFRVRPMWAFSVAAAVMGFVILGRRLHKMKKKTKGLELKVTVDDKKVSQFMSRAARLNEAFSVVKRVPVIRPQLPAPGVSAWPVVSLR
ncbi:ATG8-interacting protein 2-like isoform X1 [Lycium ferocissimum]|uniref:ATG8-interacting protein 2-like isoform X1 n=1 Tax=Lycium ferocissimum TaxID=112874 RepID=UPI002815CD4F|nr:ATG8-interacting protein 2-like isoform X1 [Lycium ferocissimum]